MKTVHQNRWFPHTQTIRTQMFPAKMLLWWHEVCCRNITHCGVYATTFNGCLQIQQLDETGSSQDWNQKGQCILTQWLHSNVSVHSKNIPSPRLVCISSGTFYSRTAVPYWQKTSILFSGVHYILVFMFVSAKAWPVWAFFFFFAGWETAHCVLHNVEFQLKVQVLSFCGGELAKT